MTTKKKEKPRPQFIKDSRGRTTHVYLPIKLYNRFERDLKKYKKLQEEGLEFTIVDID